MAFSPTPDNDKTMTIRTRDLVFVIITNSLCIVATLLLCLRVYTYLSIVQRKGTKALMWAVLAWALGFPCMVIYDYGVFQPNLKSPHLYRFSAVIFMCFAISFARIGILMYIFDVQRAAYQPGKYILFGVVLMNLFNSSIFAIVALTYMFCHEVKYDPTHISCPEITTVIELFIAVGAWSALTDLLLAMYPGLLIWNLQIRRKIKLIIVLLMSLGIIATIFALGKIIDFGIVGAGSHAFLGNLFHVIEMWVLLIASSAAPLWPLLKQLGKGKRVEDVEKSKVKEES